MPLFGLFGPPDVWKLEEKGNIKGLIRALGYDKDRDVRWAAAKALGRIGDARAVEPLIAALKDDCDNVCGQAAEVLGQLGDARAVEPLIAALKDESSGRRSGAAIALGRIGDTRAVEPLIAVLEDESEFVREFAAEALGQIGDARAVEPLIAALKDEDLRQSAVQALDQLEWESDRGQAAARYWMAKGNWEKCVAIGAPAVKLLIDALQHGDRSVRRQAAEALGQIGDARAVEPLVAALEDEDDPLSIEATEALGRIGDSRAVEPLIAALSRWKSAAGALNQLGWEPGRDEVGAQYWMAKGEWEKCVAIGAPAVKPLIGALQYGNWQAAEALGQIGDTRAVEPLIAALKDEDSFVRWQAAKALGQIGDTRAVEPLIAALKDESKQVRGPAAKALRRIGDARAVESLIAALKDKSKQVREPAAEVLGQIGNPRAVEPLIKALKDDDNNDVRIAAARALVALYASTSLDDAHKQTILSLRDTITSTGREHHDTHKDIKRPGACYDMHDDRPAIRVDFPL